jgi:hypothetical protein
VRFRFLKETTPRPQVIPSSPKPCTRSISCPSRASLERALPQKSLLPQKSVFCPKSLFTFASDSLITIYNRQFVRRSIDFICPLDLYDTCASNRTFYI